MGNYFQKNNKYQKFDENACPICLSEMKNNNTIILDCCHKFHASCIFKSLASKNFKCPLCRRRIKYKYPRRRRTII